MFAYYCFLLLVLRSCFCLLLCLCSVFASFWGLRGRSRGRSRPRGNLRAGAFVLYVASLCCNYVICYAICLLFCYKFCFMVLCFMIVALLCLLYFALCLGLCFIIHMPSIWLLLWRVLGYVCFIFNYLVCLRIYCDGKKGSTPSQCWRSTVCPGLRRWSAPARIIRKQICVHVNFLLI